MYPTRLQVKQRFLALLDDPAASVFTDVPGPGGAPSLFQAAFSEAYDILFSAFLSQQVPRIENVLQGIIVPPMATVLTPEAMGITDFADWEWLRERAAGSTDNFRELIYLDDLTQRPPLDRLIETVWQNNAFHFVGATTVRELQIKYAASGEAPLADDTVIGIDGSLVFLSNYAVGTCGGRKGYDEIAQRCRSVAVGPRFDEGHTAGELFRLVQPLVRSRQHVQVAHKPYTTQRRLGVHRTVPYVQAQQGTTGGGAQNVPVAYSTTDGTIVPHPDGTTTVFYLKTGVRSFTLYWNGDLQTLNVDYTALNNEITFFPESTPQAGDWLTAEAYPLY